MLPWNDIILRYVCPTIGATLSTIMFAAPVQDLRTALVEGSLGSLNPIPWAITTGNCLGWVVYGYIQTDLFVLFGNLPGLLVSLWLNLGATNLEYYELLAGDKERRASEIRRHKILTPQGRILLTVMLLWSALLVWVGWFPPSRPAAVVGIAVNLNLVVYYASPLQAIRVVITSNASDSIHRPSMYMNVANTFFWLAYATAIADALLWIPNATGLLLALVQVALCLKYPRSDGDEALPLLNVAS